MSVVDLMVVVIAILVFSFGTIIGYTVYLGINEKMQGLDTVSNLSKEIMNNTDTTMQGFDYLFVFLLFGLFVAVLIGAFFIRTNPIFLALSIFVFIFMLVLVAQISNIFTDFATNPNVNSSHFSLMENVWNNMPVIVLVFGIMLFIVMYSKISGGGVEGYY